MARTSTRTTRTAATGRTSRGSVGFGEGVGKAMRDKGRSFRRVAG